MPKNLHELDKILYSGKLSFGEWGNKFEQKLSKFLENDFVSVVNSYNSAVLVALTVFDITAGDEIIASPMSCLASTQPLLSKGIKLRWADIDPYTGTLDPISVEKKITNRTKAIFHNHHCGYPGHITEINEIGKNYGIYIIDDAIEAFGSEYKNQKIGNTGADATVFSFQTVRLINTIEGGAISFKNKTRFEKSKLVRDLGVNRKLFRDENGEISKKCDIRNIGYAATLNEINSYIGDNQLDKIEEILKKQRSNASFLKEILFDKFKHLRPIDLDKKQHPNYWIFGVLSVNKTDEIMKFREQGLYASGVHLPNNNYSLFSKTTLPGVTEFYKNFFALPSGWWVNQYPL